MKASIILYLISSLFFSGNLAAQALQGIPDKITLGTYAGTATSHNDDSTYLRYVRELNLNTVIHNLNNQNKPFLTNLEVIASTAKDEYDRIYYYTQGYNSQWEINSSTITTNEVGFKQSNGILYSDRWSNGGNIDAELRGPRYDQEKKYRQNSFMRNDSLFYVVKIRIRTEQSYETAANICKVEFIYADDSTNMPLRYPEILNTIQVGANWTDVLLEYDYYALTSKTNFPNNEMIENVYGKGLYIVISSMTPRLKFEIDFIEFLDKEIWKDNYLDNTGSTSELETYISKPEFSDIKYFYSQDEPNLREQAIPFNTVKEAISGHANYKPLFTTYYPKWDEKYCGELQFPLIKTFNYDQMMFYYYPVIREKWLHSDYTSLNYGEAYNLLSFARHLLNRSKEEFADENIWYGLQVHGYQNDNNPSYSPLRNPTTNEIKVQTLMALAHGMKGIFFYNVPTNISTSGPISYNLGLIDMDLTRNYKYFFLRDDLIPRIRNSWETHLVKLEYYNKYDQYFYDPTVGDLSPYNNTGNINGFELENLSGTNHHILVTQLDNKVEPSKSIYYSVINLVTSTSYHPNSIQPISIKYEIPSLFNGYRNIRFRDLEDSFDETFDNNSTQANYLNHNLSPGDGVFIQTGPVLKIGGNFVFDDTVKTAITLTEAMTIKPNATLTLNKFYSISEDIYVEDGGMVETNLYGGIAFSNNAELLFADWSDGLVISQNDTHPKLYWTEYPSEESTVKYEIYRKKDSPNFQLVHTITDKSITEFTDTDVNIMLTPAANPTNAKYYVKVYERPTKVWIEQDQTITVTITPVYGEAPAKKLAEELIITEYKLEQNHPNPFNPTTVITYQVPKQSHVTIKVYDILGKEITELVNSTKAVGIYNVTFDATSVSRRISSGTYIYRMEAGKYVESRKMIILK
ncbi:MAG: T9SS type A sorting domain-containing protein [Ignavibacteriae bacterium]|nr:T9SS C-terminal target domain-containing protein [Ignavibacteriota bacterium]NOG99655.1 T9SS type A sorting domain-containing protein [Ignavibacteriota bacterium]